MNKVPKKVLDRFSATLKNYIAIAVSQKEKDVSEADTVTLVKDILSDVFGFDKYNELSSEHQVKGTYCDLAVKIDGKPKYLVEVKAADITLNDSHIRQAVNYGVNSGIKYVVLTNALDWRLYRVNYAQPISYDEISSFNLQEINLKDDESQTKLFLLCREGINVGAIDEYDQHAQIFNRYVIAQMVLVDPVVSVIRRELRRIFPGIKVDGEDISDILVNEVLKREVIEGDKSKEVEKKIKRAMKAADADKKTSAPEQQQDEPPQPQSLQPPANS